MKSLSQKYNSFITSLLVCMETLLCGAMFWFIIEHTENTKWEKIIMASDIQVTLTLMLIFALCDSATGIVLFKRKVFAFEIVGRISRTMFFFSVSSFLIFQIGHYMDAWSYSYLYYLITLGFTLCLERLILRYIVKKYRTKGKNLRYVVLVGSSRSINELYYEMTGQDWSGFRVIGYFD